MNDNKIITTEDGEEINVPEWAVSEWQEFSNR